jgi:hypothetical protein
LTQYRLAEGLPRVAGFSEDDSTWAGRVVDRLVNRAEVVAIEGESYRVKEARERAEQRAKKRSAARMEKKKSLSELEYLLTAQSGDWQRFRFRQRPVRAVVCSISPSEAATASRAASRANSSLPLWARDVRSPSDTP